MNKVLEENYLSGEFTFGFELEAFKRLYTYDYSYEEMRDMVITDIGNGFNMDENKVAETLKGDGSLNPNKEQDLSFEWAFPYVNFTPENIIKVINGLEYLKTQGYYTNKTCGFHVHLAFPNISSKDCVWILTQLAFDKEMQNTIMKFNRLVLYNKEYASPKFLEEIRDAFENGNYEDLRRAFTNDKYRMIRIHPQGTLEWRGPRGLLQSGRNIRHFFQLLYKFVLWISKAQEAKYINGMSKENFFNAIFTEEWNKRGMFVSGEFSPDMPDKTLTEKIKKIYDNEDSEKIIKFLTNCKDKHIVDTFFKILRDNPYAKNLFKDDTKTVSEKELNRLDNSIFNTFAGLYKKINDIFGKCTPEIQERFMKLYNVTPEESFNLMSKKLTYEDYVKMFRNIFTYKNDKNYDIRREWFNNILLKSGNYYIKDEKIVVYPAAMRAFRKVLGHLDDYDENVVSDILENKVAPYREIFLQVVDYIKPDKFLEHSTTIFFKNWIQGRVVFDINSDIMDFNHENEEGRIPQALNKYATEYMFLKDVIKKMKENPLFKKYIIDNCESYIELRKMYSKVLPLNRRTFIEIMKAILEYFKKNS